MLKATITTVNSKADIYGNRYWFFRYTDHKSGHTVAATMSSDNARVIRRTDGNMDGPANVQHMSEELPIREFNRRTKGLEYAGCVPEDLLAWVRKAFKADGKKLG